MTADAADRLTEPATPHGVTMSGAEALGAVAAAPRGPRRTGLPIRHARDRPPRGRAARVPDEGDSAGAAAATTSRAAPRVEPEPTAQWIRTTPPVVRVVLPFAIPLVTILAVVALARPDDPDAVGGLGLITVIPAPILIAAALLSVSFAASLWSATNEPSRWRTAALYAHLAALLLVLHGLAGLLEAEPRFTTAWLHVGFVDAIREYGRPLSGVDARFSWPGFFASSASFLGAAGLSSALPILRFAPLVFNLLYLLPLALVARALVPSSAGRWAVAWLFLLGNWVGQDYFSPQALAYILFLAVLGIVLTMMPAAFQVAVRLWTEVLVARSASWRARLRRSVAPAVETQAPPAVGLGAFVAIVVGFAALSMTHQLTPVVLVTDMTGLVLVRRSAARLLPVALAAVLLGWISYGASDFWMGHLSFLLPGNVGASVGANVAGRVQGSDQHLVVVGGRFLLSIVVWVMAFAGAWRVVARSEMLPLSAVVLAGAPFLILGVQSYGGEALLRLYLYTLPFMLCLAVRLFVRGPAVTRRGAAALAAVAVLITPAFYVARFGNEQFEQVRPGEVQAVAEMYRIVPKGASLVSIDPNVPWRYRDFVSYDYETSSHESALTTINALLALMPPNPRGSYLLLTRGQFLSATTSSGLPADFGQRISDLVRSSPRFRLLYSNPDASLYQLVPGRR